jgi:hypothetical protein
LSHDHECETNGGGSAVSLHLPDLVLSKQTLTLFGEQQQQHHTKEAAAAAQPEQQALCCLI